MISFYIKNLGCKVNQIEMEQLTSELSHKGFVFNPDFNKADVAIINTCTVTKKADRKSLSAIRFFDKMEKIQYLFVMGCYSELEKDLNQKVKGLTKIIPQSQKLKAATIIEQIIKKKTPTYLQTLSPQTSFKEEKWNVYQQSKNSPQALKNLQTNFFNHQRAFIKIQDGCNFFCSFCRIPFARGAPVSRAYEDILNQVSHLVDKNVGEIVISGINLGTYSQKNIRFGDLIKTILNRSKKTLIRISSIEPNSIDETFLSLLDHPNLSPHIHLPLQGTCNDILKQMNRRYTLHDFYTLLKHFYKANRYFAVSTDIITGFPTETEAAFEKGLDFIRKCRFSKLHVFPYSPRGYTVSARKYSDLPKQEKKKRVRTLLDLSKRLEKNYLKKMMGKKQRFILEKKVLPSSFNTEKKDRFLRKVLSKNYQYYQGTSEYYIKGTFAISKEETVFLGQSLVGKFCQLMPSLFLKS